MSIYPKVAALRSVPISEGTCFLLMPFVRELRSVHAAIKDVCSALNLTCERADDIYSQRPIFTTVLDNILSSEVIISDLTGRNPNVFYETGIAHSLRESQSVILLAQNLDDVPFDLRHLPIVLYNLDNIEKFQIELEHRINHSRTAMLGVNFATNYLFPLHFQPHDVKSFIDYANELSENFFTLLARCLQADHADSPVVVSKTDIATVLKTLQHVSDAHNSRWKRICNYLKMEIICSRRNFEITQEHCFDLLKQTKINPYNIVDRDQDLFSAELCFRLIERDLVKARAINWLLQYLHNPRMGNIDVVRYKIETFIVESNDQDLDASLLAILSADTASVRENAADIIGQKSITGAGRYLTNALVIEENPYAARSMITAIARQNTSDAVDHIVDWIEFHKMNWWEEPISITLRRISEDAVRKLDIQGIALQRLQSILSFGKSENRE